MDFTPHSYAKRMLAIHGRQADKVLNQMARDGDHDLDPDFLDEALVYLENFCCRGMAYEG